MKAYFNGLEIKDVIEYINYFGLEVLVEFVDGSTIWTKYENIVIM